MEFCLNETFPVVYIDILILYYIKSRKLTSDYLNSYPNDSPLGIFGKFKIPSYSITNESKCFLRLLEISAFTPCFTPPVTDVNAGECGSSLFEVLRE